ncbi:ROK family protein [Novosphingobium sp.]|uniref:ROK family protein n=1 Tax=Novosphingobium sp. TaxID=1874826 RepID=UPI002B472131|nr:ROK family protein [Novosphingobium sp.]HKR92227.1 ROK family protein [Novosphingobium sp.]
MSGNFGGIELGGTKTVVVLGHPGDIRERLEFPTTTPDETLSHALDIIQRWHERVRLDAVGVASFGPLRLDHSAADFSAVLQTPKPGWTGTRILPRMAETLDLPIAVDTDVAAAALAEHKFGAAQGCSVMVYLTIGTGLGGGILIHGVPVHGALHPEIGHVRLRRAVGDIFAGGCPFHGDCAEGLLGGPALALRFGAHPSHFGAGDPVWDPVAHDLAELLGMLILTLSPQRIVVGGGVANKQPHLLLGAVSRIPEIIRGYVPDCTKEELERRIVPAALGDDAGPTGALILAEYMGITSG